MTIRLFAALTIIVAMPAAAQQRADLRFPQAKVTERCPSDSATLAAARRKGPPPMKLGDQPPAAHIYAVWNFDGRCSRPVVLRDGIGNNPERAVPMQRELPRTRPAD